MPSEVSDPQDANMCFKSIESLCRPIRTLCLVLAVSVVACAGANDRALRASNAKGRTEVDVVRNAGQPAVNGSLDQAPAYVSDICNYPMRGVAVRFMEYHVPSEGVAGVVRNALNMRPSLIIVVCLDASSKVIYTSQIAVD
jgi:hypothetical protein